MSAVNAPDPTRVSGASRREPPRFRRVEVARVTQLSPRLVRVTFYGDELEGFTVELPAASVRLLLPSPAEHEVVIPTWNGNEFLLADGTRPIIRTFTPRRVDIAARELDLEIVIHDGGAASAWALVAETGNPAAVSGPGRSYAIDGDETDFLLVGDESAIPAIGQLLEHLPPGASIEIHIEVAQADARLNLPPHPNAVAQWHDLPRDSPPGETLVRAVRTADLGPDTRIWAAGEAAAMQRIRRHLFEDRGLPRSRATVRGYWKIGRKG